MRRAQMMAAAFAAVTWIGFHPSLARANVTAWSTSAATCVPVNDVGRTVAAGAVTAGAGTTVVLYCGVPSLPGAFDTIDVTYRGGAPIVIVGTAAAQVKTARLPPFRGAVLSELIELSKATGAETVKCGVEPKGSSAITTATEICNNSHVDFGKNFYYVRIVVSSGIAAGQQMTVYGTSLISTR